MMEGLSSAWGGGQEQPRPFPTAAHSVKPPASFKSICFTVPILYLIKEGNNLPFK